MGLDFLPNAESHGLFRNKSLSATDLHLAILQSLAPRQSCGSSESLCSYCCGCHSAQLYAPQGSQASLSWALTVHLREPGLQPAPSPSLVSSRDFLQVSSRELLPSFFCTCVFFSISYFLGSLIEGTFSGSFLLRSNEHSKFTNLKHMVNFFFVCVWYDSTFIQVFF